MTFIADTVVTYEKQTCASCSIRFAVDAAFLQKRRADGSSFFCPVGHSLVFTKTDADRLKEKLKAAEARERRERDDKEYFAGRLDETQAELKNTSRNLKTVKTKMRKQTERIAAGVCPCCNRSFENVGRHMKTKHPHYVDGAKSK